MKVHTTENLNSSRDLSTSITIPEEVRLDYSDLMRLRRQESMPDSYAKSLAFRGKKQLIKPVVDGMKKTADKENFWDKLFKSGFFSSTLDLMKHEVLVQAAISCVICVGLRPATIMALPGQKDKQDNMYAAGHSVSSGLMGLLSSFLIATPFSKGAGYMQKNLLHELDAQMIKKMYPNVNMSTIWKDASKKEKKLIGDWIDVQGNKFSPDFKNVIKVAEPKPISLVSEETLKSLGVDIDRASMNGKSANEWLDKNGNKIHLELRDMFILVKEDGIKGYKKGKEGNFFSLQHIDDKFLAEVFPKLDIASITNKEGKRLHTDYWKNTDGSKFKIDMDTIHVSSYRETASAIPLYTGRTRIDTKTKELKYTSYQRNNGIKDNSRVPEKLGSEIQQSWLDADAKNDFHYKLITWMPDILTRPIVAAATIEMLPIILKKVFHLEKSKKKDDKAVIEQQNNDSVKPIEISKAAASADIVAEESSANAQEDSSTTFKARPSKNSPSFKGKIDKAIDEWIGRTYAKYYAIPLTNKNWVRNLAEQFTKIPGDMTEHMATLGSAITSGVYVSRTLNNKDLDDDKKKTLAINQGLCFVFPTIGAYTINHFLLDARKLVEYRYAGLQEQLKSQGKLTPKQLAEVEAKLGDRLKAIRPLTALFTFTLIYRYITPVLVTPFANWLGEVMNKKQPDGDKKAKEIQMNTAPSAKEVNIKVDQQKVA